MKFKLYVMAGIILFASQIYSGGATAETRNPALDETVTVRMGPFLANLDATVKVRGQDLKVDENIDTSDVDFSIYGLWRITPQLRLEVGYSGIDKESTDTLNTSIALGSLTIPAGLSMNEKFETNVVRMALGYAFYRGDSSEFGVDLGVNYTTIKESFRVNVPGFTNLEVNSVDVSEPLPTIGLFFNYAFSPDWYLTSRPESLRLT